MAKKPKKKKPSLLSFLLQEFKGRPDSEAGKKEQKEKDAAKVSFAFSSDALPADKNAQLFPSLMRNLKIRTDSEVEDTKKAQEKNVIMNSGGGAEEEDEEEESDDQILPPDPGKDLLAGRFDVLPTNPLGDDYLKRAHGAVISAKANDPKMRGLEENASQTRRNADNYRQMYLEQRAMERSTEAEKEEDPETEKRKAREAANKKAQEDLAASNYRCRARELQTQIAWWRQQSGTGQYDETTISGNVYNLQSELNSIPPEHW